MKTVYIAHPVSNDIKGNVKKILAICAEAHTHDVIPVVPYLVALQYLNDTVREERQLGIAANEEHFKRGMVDEVWLYGDFISTGMKQEIRLAWHYGIPVVAKTMVMRRHLRDFYAAENVCNFKR